MIIDWLSGAAGGALIGLAAGLLLLFNGRIAGISGIYGSALRPAPGDGLWRWLFVAGLVTGGLVLALVHPASLPQHYEVGGAGGWSALVAAGLLVGVGTRLGSGCTSGHGICGVARLSPRSLLATITFMITGMLTVWVSRHLIGG